MLLLTCLEYDNGDGQVTAIVESTDLTLPGDQEDPCTGHRTEFELQHVREHDVAVTDPRFSGLGNPPQTIVDPDAAGSVESVTDELSHVTAFATYDDFNMPHQRDRRTRQHVVLDIRRQRECLKP